MRARLLAPLGILLVAGCDDHLLGVLPDGEAPSAYTCDWAGVREFFDDYCHACHSGANPSGGFDLVATIEAELGGAEEPFYVVPGDPDASRLWQSLAGIGSATLMPYGYTIPLELAQTGHVECWIREGAQL